ncbi:MAG: hypothetical protein ACAI38_14140 [Myxococcota bacterium]
MRVEKMVVAELEALDIKVVQVDGQATGERERRIELALFAEDHKALAALRIVRSEGELLAEVWVRQETLGRPIFKRLALPATGPEESASIAALRVTELLRVRAVDEQPVVEDRSAEPPPERAPELITPAPAPAPAPEAPRSWSVRAGVTMLVMPGGIGPAGGFMLAVRKDRLLGRAALEIDGWASVIGTRVRRDEASASMQLAGARAFVLWPWTLGAIEWSAGAGTGVLFASASGDDAPRLYASERASDATGYVGATLQAMVPLSERLRLRAATDLGMTFSEIQVEFAGEPVATLGRPLWGSHLAVEVAF